MNITKIIRDACEKNGTPELASLIRVEWSNRMTRCMGLAIQRRRNGVIYERIIRLSARLWRVANEDQRENTVVHEACHIIARHKYGGLASPHGSHWQHTMRVAGRKPSRCHDVDTTLVAARKPRKRYEVWCPGCRKTLTMGPVRFKRLRAGTATYRCAKCGSDVE